MSRSTYLTWIFNGVDWTDMVKDGFPPFAKLKEQFFVAFFHLKIFGLKDFFFYICLSFLDFVLDFFF